MTNKKIKKSQKYRIKTYTGFFKGLGKEHYTMLLHLSL
jgi:hypothetical protein